MRRVLVGGVLIAVTSGLLWIFLGAFGKNVREVPFMLKGQPAPAFNLPRIDGEGLISSEALRGKPVVLNVWASWCGPCAVEHPVLEWGAKRFGDRATFIGLAFEDTLPDAKAFLRRHGSSFPQLFDEASRVSVEYAVAGVPETYFITADGIILDKHVGPLSREALMARIAELTGGAQLSGRLP
jgi:cytochrome c biogenesis protein CcmG, thiol:disulfide interchange protein DsbE